MFIHHQIILILFVGYQVLHFGVFSHRCPGTHLELEEFQSASPYANTSAGQYFKLGVLSMEKCIYACCEMLECNIVFIHNNICYLIKCESDKYCEPLPRDGVKFQNTYIVKVRSVQDYSGMPTVNDLAYDDGILETPVENVYLRKNFIMRRGGNPNSQSHSPASCTSEDDCRGNEECALKSKHVHQKTCQCVKNFVRDEMGNCITSSIEATTITPIVAVSPRVVTFSSNTSISTISPLNNLTTTPSATVTTTLRHLVVSAGGDKIVQLPDNAISLSAFAVPKESEGEQYKYEWTLVTHPTGDETGTMSEANSATMKLSELKEGLYTFNVTVSSDQAFGEASVNVTVLPPKRVNQSPVAAINPVNQTVKLPTTDTVLDGSASTDDDKIVSYIWEIVSAPMGYVTPQLTETATLQLKSLIQGFYRFMLTVTDSDGAKNATYANVTVIKEMDYPPTANAGSDVIIYLPQKEVTLNGSLSTDDKGIKSWEWTKGDGVNKAVDMQNTRTPFLNLSNLEVGMYTFVLRVTDTADQTSTAEVHVFVKPGNEGPVAEAGQNQEIMLPLNTVTLDGSKSHDDVSISQWEWKQVNGPASAKIESIDQPKTTISELTKGVYVFQLTVYDDKKATDSKTVTITVKQSKNDPPRANAGGDHTIELPRKLVVLNGSASTDDAGIVAYAWTRDPSSLAAGEILDGTENSSLLMLTGLVPGRYLFKLTVMDDAGATSSDTASIIIKPASTEKNDIEMCIAIDIYSFTEEQKVTLAKKLALLLQEEVETVVKISKISMEKDTGRVILVFHVEKMNPGSNSVISDGPIVVHTLKKRLKLDSGLLNVPVIYLNTVICQNNCSGHGTCDQSTKECICEAFWMENIFRYYFSDKESNCDWSILYVTIVLFVIIISCGAIIWGVICLCSCQQRKNILPISRLRPSRPRRKHRYSRLEVNSDKEAMQMLPKDTHQNNSVMVSDSDLESDTLFEQNGKTIGRLSNGFSKLPDEGGRSPQKVRT